MQVVGAASLDDLIDKTVPAGIRAKTPLDLPPSRTEHDVLAALAAFAEGNQVLTSFIGLGYAGTITPPVIQEELSRSAASPIRWVCSTDRPAPA